MLRTGTLFRVATLLALGFVGCSKADGGTTGKLQFGACCERDDDCGSGVCGADQGVCTVECTSDDDCPAEPKSGKPDCKTSEGVCQAETAGVECSPDSDSDSGTSGSSSGGSGSAGSSSGGGGSLATAGKGGSTSTGGKGGSAGSGGKGGSGGAGDDGIGIGDPCSDDEACRSGICYRPGGSPGFCTTTCSVSFDTACFGDGEAGDTTSGEIIYCMPFGNGGRCYPACINSDICSDYAGMVCTSSVKDIADYNGTVCQERL